MKLYKLTDSDNQTRGGMQWGENVTHAATGEGAELCTDGLIHCYTSPLLAVLMDPAHANYLARGGKLWLAEGDVTVSDSLKAGCKTLTTLKQIEIPVVTLEQRVAFGILNAKLICADPAWNTWADKWLSGEDRSAEAAAGAVWAAVAREALEEAMWAVAAGAAALVAREAWEEAVWVAEWAAEAAVWAVWAVAGKSIDFGAIAEKAKEYGAKQ